MSTFHEIGLVCFWYIWSTLMTWSFQEKQIKLFYQFCDAPVKAQRTGTIRLAEPYIDRFGKKRATGNRRRLKASQFFGYNYMLYSRC
jgi:hypothetical protein